MKQNINKATANFILLVSLSLSACVAADEAELDVMQVYGNALSGPDGLTLNEKSNTASRLGLTLMDTPASAEIISREEIVNKGDYTGLSAVTRATGFYSSANPANGGTATSARGFSGHSSVVNLFDGTRLYVGANTVTFPADSWTLEKIEVLRGPGSVIHGVGAVGGTINYVPKKPEFEAASHELDISLGSFGLQRYAYGSGGQVTDELAYRFDAVNHRSDGYVERAAEERNAIAAALLYQPTQDLQIQFSIDYADTDAAPYWGTPLINGRIDDRLRRTNFNIKDGFIEYQDLWPRLLINWQVNEQLRLRSETYYMKADRHWLNVELFDYNSSTNLVDRTLYLEIKHKQKQIGNRSDLLFDFDVAGMNSRLNIGAEINSIDFTHINNRPYAGLTSVDVFDPVPGVWAEGVVSETTKDLSSDTLQYAVFIDNVLQLNEQWQLVTGLREDIIDFQRRDFARSNGEPAAKIDDRLSGSSWRLGLVFQPNIHTSLYGQYSTAMDAIESILTATDPQLDLARGRQIELGIKQQFWQQRLQYTLAFYDIVKTDLLSTDPGGLQRQIGEQSSRGIEFELYLLLLDQLSVDFNMALTDPEYDEFVSGSNDFGGNIPRDVAKKTANLWLNWQFDPRWSVGTGARYVGKRFADDANSTEIPAYTVWDASLNWQVSPQLRLALRGKNLSDSKDYVLAPYGNQWVLAPGRSGEISMNYVF